MAYSTYISISEQFRSSVNIEYDLTNFSKIEEYIPTEDACEIMHQYFNAFKKSQGNNRATILEGPYGKGKSYLLLSLIQMISCKSEDEKQKVFHFLNKMSLVDKELYKEAKSKLNSDFRLLPIIVNSNYAHLSQSLNIALKDALARVGLDDLFPKNAYGVCLEIIEKWKSNPGNVENEIKQCLDLEHTTLGKLEKGLKKFDSNSYKQFVRLYNCVVNGLEFNPFTNDDIVKNYSDIASQLKNKGYNGVFIVFDEFSKFIEADNKELTNELKILQDLAEMSCRTGNSGQVHLCCITHKSLNSYYKNKNEIVANSFKTVEGRFNELHFNRSLNQNYRIISMTLKKAKTFDNYFNNVILQTNNEFYKRVSNYELFSEIDSNLICKECFPLNPLTTYSMIQISELIAQNERTLFTLISDSDVNSLSTFIKKRENGLFNVDSVYDYFEKLLEKSEDEEIRKVSYQTKVCLSKAETDLQRRVIKTITIIKIINNFDLFGPKEQMIADCLYSDIELIKVSLNELLDLNLLKKSFATGNYDFAQIGSKEIDEKVEKIVTLKRSSVSISNILNELFNSSFVLPRRYNAEHKITRFYKELFITDEELMKLNSFNYFYDHYFCDGLIFNVISTENKGDISTLFRKIGNNNRVILKEVDDVLKESVVDEIYRLYALNQLLSDKNMDDMIKSEIKFMIEDEIEELKHILNKVYSVKNVNLISKIDGVNFNAIISDLFEREFGSTPIVNNEMINKEYNVSQQYIKPRNTVVLMYLAKDLNKVQDYSVTSPEMTVFNSFDPNEKNTREAIDLIKAFFTQVENQKVGFKEIISDLKVSPYGLRNGVLPLFIGCAISELSGEVILYFENKEIDLNAENINKLILKPEKYFLEIETGTNEKNEFVKGIISTYGVKTASSYRDNVKIAVQLIKKNFLAQPRIVRDSNKKNNILDFDEKFIKLKTMFTSFNINNHSTLLKEFPSLFDMNYDISLEYLKQLNVNIEKKIDTIKENISSDIKLLLAANQASSLTNCLSDWLNEKRASERVLEEDEKALLSIVSKKNYNDLEVIDDLSKIITGTKVTDWSSNKTKDIIDFIKNVDKNLGLRVFVSAIEVNEIKEDNTDYELSSFGEMVKGNIEDVLDEFGDSVSAEEKIQILKSIIKQIM